jgi:prepilin-type N-terminal cleavage/methylation domain-containing protein
MKGMHQHNASSGFTLVELMVASVCLGLAISGAMSMIGAGRQIEMENWNRRQARMLAYSALENNAYHYLNFSSIIVPYSQTSVVQLNPGTPLAINATLVVTSDLGYFTMHDPDGETPPSLGIQYKWVRAAVNWTVAGHADSVHVRKRITEFQ